MRTLQSVAQRAHNDALAASRRAIAAGDLAKAERWMKLANQHYRAFASAQKHAEMWRERLRKREGRS
jgi:hypothetical protein